MPRKVRVLTTSYAGDSAHTVTGNRDLACAFVDAAGAEHADLVCLPENFLHTGIARDQLPIVEALSGATISALAPLARKHGTWVVVPLCLRTDGGRIENSAVVLNRRGELAGRYAKVHPTIGECEAQAITPGSDATVIETDFGRVGLAICYDIGWPEHWQQLRAQGAEIVVWPSAYDGGFPLQAYAWSHFYYVISAVRTEHSRVIDVTGRILASTSRWHHLAAMTIDLEKEVFHTDAHAEKLFQLQQAFGQRVSAQAFTEEHIFTVESNDPSWPLARIKEAYGLENFRDYHARATCVQDNQRVAAKKPASVATDD